MIRLVDTLTILFFIACALGFTVPRAMAGTPEVMPATSEAMPATPEAMIAEALEGGYGQFLGEGTLSVTLSQTLSGDVERLSNLRFDPRSGRFAAVLWQGGRPLGVSGMAWVEVTAPVPAKRLEAGSVIGADDLTELRLPASRLQRGAVMDAGSLIGREVIRTLYPGRTIAEAAVRQPIAVERNQPITLIYLTDGLRLTARGRALKQGSVGDRIPVHNPSGDRTVEAVITGNRTAEVF